KVLDFGLAKLAERETDTNAGFETTQTDIGPRTLAGAVLGTPAYMSPEQAAGLKVDLRSDIFSFGVVLYQMATGEMAFQGNTSVMILAAILRDDPKPPSAVAPDVPLELERLIMRCLRKEPEQRYQHMMDVKIALEDLKEDSVSGRLISRPVSVARPGRPKRWPLAIGAAVLVILGVGGGAWWLLNRPSTAALEQAPTQLTSDPGLSIDPAISPDGKLLAYASDRGGEANLDIWVSQIGGGDSIRLTRHKADDYAPDFSPDGTKIVFRSDRDGGGIYVISTLGAEERKIAEEGRQPRFSPDGKWIAYSVWPVNRLGTRAGSGKTYIVDSQGGPPRQLQPDFAAAIWPTWAPDGKHLLFFGTKTALAAETSGWWVTPLDGGAAVQVVGPPGQEKSPARWEPFAWWRDRILFVGMDAKPNIKEVPISARTWKMAGTPHQLTFGTTREESPSVSSDGRMVFASVVHNLDVYSLPVNANQGKPTGGLQRLTKDLSDDYAASVSADGKKLAFQSTRSGTVAIWTKDLETGQEKLLINATKYPVIRPDGAAVAWNGDGKTIMIVPFAGGTIREMCADCGTPVGWSSDGKKILFTDYSKQSSIGVLDVASGQKIEYLKHSKYSLFPRSFSPDSRWVGFSAEVGDGRQALMIAPFRPGDPPAEKEWIAITDGSTRDSMPRWSPDGNLLYFLSDRDGFRCILAQRLDPVTKRRMGAPFGVLHLHGAALSMGGYYLWAANDKLVFYLRERTGNIWMSQLAK
ncbi:MAG: PD40 domain-containing protein, partial [Acidobacteria bacterium]|nr:PD40 domain-containing protein [Acidobacteriota bacterium]